MLETIIILYSIYTFMKIYIGVMQIGYINQEKRKDPVLMPAGKYMIAGNYAVANGKVELVSTSCIYFYRLFNVYMVGVYRVCVVVISCSS